jgi:hypothetical protein
MEKIMAKDQENPSGMTDENASGNSQTDMVAYETYQKALSQEKAAKDKSRAKDETISELKARLDEFEAQKKAAEEQRLKDNEQWKEIAAKKEDEAQAALQEAQALKNQWQRAEKMSAIGERLPGKMKNSEYWSLVDIDAVQVDDDGSLNQDSLELVVNNFVENHGILLDTGKSKSGLPGDAPAAPKGKLSKEQWKKLPLKERQERLHEVIKF